MHTSCECDYLPCIASGVPCECVCHDEIDHRHMRINRTNRLNERCKDCRFSPITCGSGNCFCSCHGDRPMPLRTQRIVTPGHDSTGHERGFVIGRIAHPVEPNLDTLIALRDRYREQHHPEWTIGGAAL